MEIYKGRPDSMEGRIETERATYDFLDRLEVEYSTACHEAAFSMEACRTIKDKLGVAVCKNLFLCNRQQTDFYLLIIPGDKIFKTKYLSSQLGCARLSFADEGHMRDYLNVTPGSVSVLALQNDPSGLVRLVIDRDLLAAKDFGCHPCINTSTVRFSTSDLLNRIIPALHHEPTFVDLPWE